MALTQRVFRGVNDDGSESASTFIAALNANWAQDVDVNFRIRFEATETANSNEEDGAQLQYNLASGGWNNVNAASSVVRSFASAHFADDDDTTQRIGSGAFVATNGGMDEVEGFANEAGNRSKNDSIEYEFCVQIRSVDVTDAQTLQLRIVRGGGAGVFDTYTQTPTITVNEGVAAQTVTPDPVAANLGTPVPTIVPGPVTLTPAPVVSAFSLPVPTITNIIPPQTVTPDPVFANFSLPVPTILAGAVVLSPDPAVANFVLPVPTVTNSGAVGITRQVISAYMVANA